MSLMDSLVFATRLQLGRRRSFAIVVVVDCWRLLLLLPLIRLIRTKQQTFLALEANRFVVAALESVATTIISLDHLRAFRYVVQLQLATNTCFCPPLATPCRWLACTNAQQVKCKLTPQIYPRETIERLYAFGSIDFGPNKNSQPDSNTFTSPKQIHS